MFKSIKVNYSTIYFIALIVMLISLPLSRFGLSVAQFALLGNWLLEGDFKRKCKDIIWNKPALVLISLFILHVIGLIYTSDFEYAFKDLRIKLPILALPVILATTKPLDNKKFDILLLLYIGAVIAGTFISFGVLLTKDISDIREISPFISHIRLSLNVCIAIFFSGYFAFFKFKNKIKLQFGFLITIFWLITFLFIIESVTGVFILLFTCPFLVLYSLLKIKNIWQKVTFILILIIIPLFILMFLNNTVRSYRTPYKNNINNLEVFTSHGNPYQHDTLELPVENGSYVGLYVCDIELRDAWNKRSNMNYVGKDKKSQDIKFTLIRYLNSKDLRKDADGVNQLNEKDISNIENGIANIHYTTKISINSRIYKILWEYEIMNRGGNPGGHSLIQRFEFWKASIGIIKNNFWFGVGTGDINKAFKVQYEKINSILAPEWRHRAHNQFLAIFITFGFLGFLWFLFTLIYPPLKLKMLFDYRYFVFLITIILSMLVEDTLETQMGVTLFAFMNSFLLFVRK